MIQLQDSFISYVICTFFNSSFCFLHIFLFLWGTGGHNKQTLLGIPHVMSGPKSVVDLRKDWREIFVHKISSLLVCYVQQYRMGKEKRYWEAVNILIQLRGWFCFLTLSIQLLFRLICRRNTGEKYLTWKSNMGYRLAEHFSLNWHVFFFASSSNYQWDDLNLLAGKELDVKSPIEQFIPPGDSVCVMKWGIHIPLLLLLSF